MPVLVWSGDLVHLVLVTICHAIVRAISNPVKTCDYNEMISTITDPLHLTQVRRLIVTRQRTV